MISEKKAQANRENSRLSTGPTSPKGKARSRLNAVKFGLFSRQLVVAAAGEKQDEFDEVRSMVWEQFQPEDAVTAFLAEELVGTFWRLQRPRRYETAEIRRRLDTAKFRRHYEKRADVELLVSKFLRTSAHVQSSSADSAERSRLSLSLEEMRMQLEKTAMGLGFLVSLIEPLVQQASDHGYLTEQDEKTLVEACGLGDHHVRFCLALDLITKEQLEKVRSGKSAGKSTFQSNKRILEMALKSKVRSMQSAQTIIVEFESQEEEQYLGSLIMLPAEASDKIHRAEAALERHFFKTLGFLLALKGVESPT